MFTLYNFMLRLRQFLFALTWHTVRLCHSSSPRRLSSTLVAQKSFLWALATTRLPSGVKKASRP